MLYVLLCDNRIESVEEAAQIIYFIKKKKITTIFELKLTYYYFKCNKVENIKSLHGMITFLNNFFLIFCKNFNKRRRVNQFIKNAVVKFLVRF